MTIMRALGALFAAIVLASCASAPSPQHGPAQITLQRTACFGFCPDYTVTIDEAGEVRYEGRRFVSAVGVRDAVIPREDVQRLLARFDEIGFERLRDESRAQITDLPSTIVTLTRNGRTKRVVDYGGTSVGMPESVRGLQAEIDRVAGTARWVLRDGHPVGAPAP